MSIKTVREELPLTKDVLLEHFYAVVVTMAPQEASVVTGMFAHLTTDKLMTLLGNRQLLEEKILEAVETIESSSPVSLPGSQTDIHRSSQEPGADSSLDHKKCELGELLYIQVLDQESELASQITGMLLELDVQSIQRLLSDPDRLKLAIQTARTEYTKSHTPSVSPDPAQTTPGIDPAEISGDDIALWLYDRVNDLYPHNAAKITGMILELGVDPVQTLYTQTEQLVTVVERCKQSLIDTDQWLQTS